jgi:hypothetical protein
MSAAPTVSVVMVAHEASPSIDASIGSILSQTHGALELILCDQTPPGAMARALAPAPDTAQDPRLIIVRNEAAESGNACLQDGLARARGSYVGLLAQGDLSAPTRLARQLAWLEANPQAVAITTASRVLAGGALSDGGELPVFDSKLLHWLFLLGQPQAASSLLIRVEAARALGPVTIEGPAGALVLFQRLNEMGEIGRLDQPLTVVGGARAQAAEEHDFLAVLEVAYRPIFGSGAQAAAARVGRHIALGDPVPDAATLRELAVTFARLNATALEGGAPASSAALLLHAHAARIWARVLTTTAASGSVTLPALLATNPAGIVPGWADRARVIAAALPFGRVTARKADPEAAPEERPPDGHLYGRAYHPVKLDPQAPPTLFVVVDTEAEFDWHKPFARELTSTHAMDFIGRGQAVFDTFGLRPIYVVDYPVASQKAASACLRDIHARGGCEIGAHLHPWTTPPFEEDVSNINSYPGNLDPGIEARKLATLVQAIRDTFGISPRFYKAGRYGFGPTTTQALIEQGIAVDLSVLPGTDLTGQGGPDFRGLSAIPYRIGGTGILAVPMTRESIGFAPRLAQVAQAVHRLPGGARIPVAPLLARLRLADTITLTPEGVTTQEQIRLLRALLARGRRQFVLHYHSPSLSPGNTPYARDAEGAETMLRRLEEVCGFFFDRLGGLPGNPADLVRILQ